MFCAADEVGGCGSERCVFKSSRSDSNISAAAFQLPPTVSVQRKKLFWKIELQQAKCAAKCVALRCITSLCDDVARSTTSIAETPCLAPCTVLA